MRNAIPYKQSTSLKSNVKSPFKPAMQRDKPNDLISDKDVYLIAATKLVNDLGWLKRLG